MVVVLATLAVDFVTDGRLTAHIDRANDYLDALRTDRAAAAQMLCPGADDGNAEALATTVGQFLTEFDVSNGDGQVAGSVALADGTTRPVLVHTSGPTFPGGDDPAAEVCIAGTQLP